jgi:DNA-binding NarL/FixJ family response regulator
MGGERKMEKTRIFIVDDHEIVRLGLVQFLNSHEHLQVCGQAGDANSAIAAINECKPDIAIVDISLEGVSGIDLIKAIRVRYRQVAVMALSMHAEKEIVRRALQAGAGGYVLKSEPVDQVVEAIEKVVAGKSYISESLRESLMDMVSKKDEGPEELLAQLTDRELDIFKLIGEGLDRREIARRMGISTSTIGTYRDRIKNKLNMNSSGELIRFAVKWTTRGGQED